MSLMGVMAPGPKCDSFSALECHGSDWPTLDHHFRSQPDQFQIKSASVSLCSFPNDSETNEGPAFLTACCSGSIRTKRSAGELSIFTCVCTVAHRRVSSSSFFHFKVICKLIHSKILQSSWSQQSDSCGGNSGRYHAQHRPGISRNWLATVDA